MSGSLKNLQERVEDRNEMAGGLVKASVFDFSEAQGMRSALAAGIFRRGDDKMALESGKD